MKMRTYHLKNLLTFSLISAMTIIWVACSSDDAPINVPEEEETKTYFSGVFLDSPVNGLTFVTEDTTGITDSDGTFVYAEDNSSIEFFIGDLSLGTVSPNDMISPLDFGVGNATIYSTVVSNMAALLQSLDSDGDPSNGIEITQEVADELTSNTLNLEASTFVEELVNLVDELQSTLNIDLSFVHPNAAAEHLAASLGLESQIQFRPTVKQGRRWEDGKYLAYNTPGYDDPDSEFFLEVIGDSVVYYFGSGVGYIFDKSYSGDTLYGIGNLYFDILTNIGTSYEYRNRISSPGFIVDHNDSTFLGYFNYRKTAGDVGAIEGTYKAFLRIDQKRQDEEETQIFPTHNQLTITLDGDSIELSIENLAVDPTTTETVKVSKDVVTHEDMFLVLLDGEEYIYANRKLYVQNELEIFYPGLITYLEED